MRLPTLHWAFVLCIALTCSGCWAHQKCHFYEVQYVGCYSDDWERDLVFQMPTSKSLTVGECAVSSHSENLKFFGVQNGNQCFGGSTFGRYGKANNCLMGCVGDARGQSSNCGGQWANAVYTLSKVKKVQQADHNGQCEPPEASHHSIGFVLRVENGQGQVLRSEFVATRKSAELPTIQDVHVEFKPSADTEVPHFPKSLTVRGANFRKGHKTTCRFTPYAYHGCFMDADDRDIELLVYNGPTSMTVEVCAEHARSLARHRSEYTVFGVQDHSQCFVGRRYGSYGKSLDCTMRCANSTFQMCGGVYANSVYGFARPHVTTARVLSHSEAECELPSLGHAQGFSVEVSDEHGRFVGSAFAVPMAPVPEPIAASPAADSIALNEPLTIWLHLRPPVNQNPMYAAWIQSQNLSRAVTVEPFVSGGEFEFDPPSVTFDPNAMRANQATTARPTTGRVRTGTHSVHFRLKGELKELYSPPEPVQFQVRHSPSKKTELECAVHKSTKKLSCKVHFKDNEDHKTIGSRDDVVIWAKHGRVPLVLRDSDSELALTYVPPSPGKRHGLKEEIHVSLRNHNDASATGSPFVFDLEEIL